MAEKPATEEAAAAAPAAAKADAASAHHVRVPDVVAALVDAPPREEPAGAAPSQQQQPKKKAAPSPAPAALKRTKSAPPQAMIKRKKSRSGPKSKSSSFIGVSQYRRTGRWEAHIWDCAKSQGTPGAKGRQLHLGSFDCAEDAARAYDRAAIHFRGANADTNYPREQYTHDPVLSALKDLSNEDAVLRLRHACQPRNCTAATKRTVPTRHANGALAAERSTLMVDKPVVEQRTKIQKRKKRSASSAADEPKKRKKKHDKKVTKQLKKQLKKKLKQLKKKLKKQLKKLKIELKKELKIFAQLL
mmetsp:Transcript_6375/g.16452  ORF Transcript_6375/g.16452 Transcript_6375/m.16452 type:complete len:302 (+) Transcript_6375:442-1347(+)